MKEGNTIPLSHRFPLYFFIYCKLNRENRIMQIVPTDQYLGYADKKFYNETSSSSLISPADGLFIIWRGGCSSLAGQCSKITTIVWSLCQKKFRLICLYESQV